MLVLSRRLGEGIVIGGNVRVTVRTVGGEVKLAIEAPKDISIYRSEIFDQMQEEQGTLEYLNGDSEQSA